MEVSASSDCFFVMIYASFMYGCDLLILLKTDYNINLIMNEWTEEDHEKCFVKLKINRLMMNLNVTINFVDF